MSLWLRPDTAWKEDKVERLLPDVLGRPIFPGTGHLAESVPSCLLEHRLDVFGRVADLPKELVSERGIS